jgi:hypothetical protein
MAWLVMIVVLLIALPGFINVIQIRTLEGDDPSDRG